MYSYFSTWDLLINVAAFLFWFRFWMPEERDIYFNPHLSSLWRFCDGTTESLRAIFFRTPARLIALSAFLFLLLFRSITFFALAARNQEAVWTLRLGFNQSYIPRGSPLFPYFVFTVLSFAIFLFVFWGVALLYAGRRHSSFNHAAETLFHVSRPFSLVRVEFRPVVLLLFGFLMVFFLTIEFMPGGILISSDALSPAGLAKDALSALRGWVEVLTVIQTFMLVLIIGSWAAMFATSPALMFFCKDWIDLLLGPLRRFPLRLGMLDLTPLLFFFALKYVIQPVLTGVIADSFRLLP